MRRALTVFRRVKVVRRVALGVMLLLGALLLSSCGARVEYNVSLYSGERWEAEMRVPVSSAQIALAGGEAEVDAALETSLAEKGQADLEWEKIREQDQIIYRLSSQGQGWENLNQEVFDGEATIHEGSHSGEIYFRFEPLSLGLGEMPLRLTGKEIVSSNANQVDGGTAIWYDVLASYGGAEAVLIPTRRSLLRLPSLNLGKGFFTYLAIVLGLGAGLYLLLRPGKASL